jgi:hypothetical protein
MNKRTIIPAAVFIFWLALIGTEASAGSKSLPVNTVIRDGASVEKQGVQCTESRVRTIVSRFIQAFNSGDAQELDRLFAPPADFGWFSVDGYTHTDRTTLVRYLEGERRDGIEMQLTSFRFNGNSNEKGHFAFSVLRTERQTAVRYFGKGSSICHPDDADVIAIWGMGRLTPSQPPKWLATARKQLAKLLVKAPGSMRGYSRAKFGPAWKDVDGNGCDTRNDILKRDLINDVFRQGSACIVVSGRLNDPYAGKVIRFKRGTKTSSAVQIDHLVALAAAWRTGAKSWTDVRRLRYANDPVVLLAVDGPTKRAKGDKDASKWLPPREAYRCRYVAKQIKIKTRYRLWVTATERDGMGTVLADCLS